jgi:hypothetical protein
MTDGFLIIGVMLALAALSVVWQYSKSSSLLTGWAAENNLQILRRQRRTFFKGPFFWTSGKGQQVFYVTVQDGEGRTRRAWVRCGGRMLGMFSNNVDVRWDEKTGGEGDALENRNRGGRGE